MYCVYVHIDLRCLSFKNKIVGVIYIYIYIYMGMYIHYPIFFVIYTTCCI